MEHADLTPKYLREPGIEIGAFKTPIPGIAPVYLDRFSMFAGESTLADYYGDACDIPYHDSSLNYVATSHVLEHVANPYAALKEWFRVLNHNGMIYMVLPHRKRTFDRLRPLTDVSHLLDDFHRNTDQRDGTHVEEYVRNLDWSLFSPTTSAEKVGDERLQLLTTYQGAIAAGLEINIHFHTFEPASVIKMIVAGNQQRVWNGEILVLKQIEDFPASNPIGFLTVAQVRKTFLKRFHTVYGKKGLRSPKRL